MPSRDEYNYNQDNGAFKCVICDLIAYTVTVFCVAQHESGARNDSVTVYSKNIQTMQFNWSIRTSAG
jgi:hypothetical protein